MSMYYYLVCDECRELCEAASRTAGGGVCPLGDSGATTPSFVVAHSKCEIRIANEDAVDDIDVDDQYVEWEQENAGDLRIKHGLSR